MRNKSRSGGRRLAGIALVVALAALSASACSKSSDSTKAKSDSKSDKGARQDVAAGAQPKNAMVSLSGTVSAMGHDFTITDGAITIFGNVGRPDFTESPASQTVTFLGQTGTMANAVITRQTPNRQPLLTGTVTASGMQVPLNLNGVVTSTSPTHVYTFSGTATIGGLIPATITNLALAVYGPGTEALD